MASVHAIAAPVFGFRVVLNSARSQQRLRKRVPELLEPLSRSLLQRPGHDVAPVQHVQCAAF